MPHPSAFAQTPEFEPIIEIGEGHTRTQIGELEYRFETHYSYLEDYDGQYIPYRLIDSTDFVQVEVNGGKIVFDKINGATTIFKNGTSVINSDSYQVRMANIDSDVWSFLAVNESALTTTVLQDEDKVTITFTRENEEGKYDIEYEVRGNLKATAKFTNNLYENTKFAFTQTLNLNDNIIELNKQTINLNDYVGQSFPREILEQNQDLIIETGNLYYNSGLGFENLWSVGVFEDNKIALDYANVEQTVTAIGETVELDPSVTLSNDFTKSGQITSSAGNLGTSSASQCTSSTKTNEIGTTQAFIGIGYGYCIRGIVDFDVTSIPDNAIISDVDLESTKFYRYYHGSIGCEFRSIASNGITSSTDATTLWNEIGSGTIYAQDTSTPCEVQTGANYGNRWAYNVMWDLGTNADSDLQAELAVDNNWDIGIKGYLNGDGSGSVSYPSVVHANGYFETGYPMKIYVTYTVPPPPNVPTSLSIDTQDVANELTLRWVAPTSGTTADGYKIGRSVDGGTWNDSYVADTGSTAITYDNTGLSPDTSYAYRVWSLAGTDASTSYASVAGTTTWDVPDQVGTVTGTADITPDLSWSAPSSDGALTNYKIYRGGVLHDTISSSVTTYSDSTSVVSGSTYAYTVSGVSAVGEGAQSVSINVVAGVPPDPPTSISATIANTATAPLDVVVTWSNPADVGTGTLSNFQIFRDGVSQGTVGLVNTFANTVPNTGTFAFTVKAISDHGTSVASSADSITTPSAPSQPTLSVTVLSDTSMQLDWTASNENSSTLQGYWIEYSLDNSVWANLVSNTGNVAVTRTATSLNVDDQYYWRVSGINGVGAGTASATQNDWTLLSAPSDLVATGMAIDQIDLAWTGISGISSYTIQYESPTGNGFTNLATSVSSSATTYTSGSLTTGTEYNYRIFGVSTNSGSNSVASNEDSANTFGILPAPVLDLLTSVTVNPASVQLDFTASSGSPLATGYKIERNLGSGWIAVNTDTGSTSTTYLDTATTSMNEPIYRVSAINTYGVSPPSNELTLSAVSSGGGGGSSGGGGGSSKKIVTAIDELLNISILGNTHVMSNGEFLTGKIPISWDSGENLRISAVDYDDSILDSIQFNIEDTAPIILQGSGNSFSSDDITYTISTPTQICNAVTSDPSKKITTNCLQEKLYELPITVTATSVGDNISQTTLITIDTRSGFGGDTLALLSIFIMVVIAGLGIIKLARKSSGGKRNHSTNGHKKAPQTPKKPRKSIK
tara:strand:- start:13 stop:3741 length:3729 start_codon:yes stop_codon:yes gene_type:complete